MSNDGKAISNGNVVGVCVWRTKFPIFSNWWMPTWTHTHIHRQRYPYQLWVNNKMYGHTPGRLIALYASGVRSVYNVQVLILSTLRFLKLKCLTWPSFTCSGHKIRAFRYHTHRAECSPAVCCLHLPFSSPNVCNSFRYRRARASVLSTCPFTHSIIIKWSQHI